MTLTAARAEDKTYVMKITLATINDQIFAFVKNYAAALEKDSDSRIKPEIYPASQLGSIARQAEGGFPALGISHVAAHGSPADLPGHGLGGGHVQIEHCDLGTGSRQMTRRLGPEARAAAGDDGRMAAYVHGLLPFRNRLRRSQR